MSMRPGYGLALMLLSQQEVDILFKTFGHMLPIVVSCHIPQTHDSRISVHVDLCSLLQLLLICCSIESVSSLICWWTHLDHGVTTVHCLITGGHCLTLTDIEMQSGVIRRYYFHGCQSRDKAVKLREFYTEDIYIEALRTYILRLCMFATLTK